MLPKQHKRLNKYWNHIILRETYDAVHRLIESATLYTPDYIKAEQIFIESVLPYVYGDAELDTVLDIAQGK